MIPAAIALALAALTLSSCDQQQGSADLTQHLRDIPSLSGSGEPAECDVNSQTVEQKSLVGFTLWSFTSVTDWCWDDTEITREPFFTTNIDNVAPFWSYEQDTRFELGGGGEQYHTDSVETKFCVFGCIGSGFVEITKSQYGNGDRTVHSAEISAYSMPGWALVVLLPLFSALLLTTGRRTLRTDRGPAWHAVGMTEVIVGLFAALYAILLLISLPAP